MSGERVETVFGIGKSKEEVAIIIETLRAAVAYTHEEIKVRTVLDTMRTNPKYAFLLTCDFPIDLYEHANQSVFGFDGATKRFKQDNDVPASEKIAHHMTVEQLQMVIQFVRMLLFQLEKAHKQGVKMTRAYVTMVGERVRANMQIVSEETEQNKLDGSNFHKAANRDHATVNRLGKSTQLYEEMCSETDIEKKRKTARHDVILKRIDKTAAKMSDALVTRSV
jgi:hypothetical protein